MAGPGGASKGREVGEDLGAERIEVEIADEFQKVRLFFHHDGPVPVLEEVAHPAVAAVEGPPHGGVRRLRMLRGRERLPVRTKRCAWFGSRAQA